MSLQPQDMAYSQQFIKKMKAHLRIKLPNSEYY